jgi:chromate reductase
MKFLIVAASLRTGSLNRKLAQRVEAVLQSRGYETTLADYRQWAVPHYDGDVDAAGKPPEVEALCAQVAAHDALIIVSPEYNFSYPGTLKNAIDWLSRYRPMPIANKPMFLASASPGLIGGNRGLWALRVPLEACGALVYPNMFSLAQASAAFDASGELADAAMRQRLESTIGDFTSYAAKLLA